MIVRLSFAETGLMFTTLKHGYAEQATARNQFHPPGICIPLILANIDWAPGIWIYFNRSSVTLDSDEAHYSVGKIRKWDIVCVCVCVCVWKRERERESERVREWEREREPEPTCRQTHTL